MGRMIQEGEGETEWKMLGVKSVMIGRVLGREVRGEDRERQKLG